MKKLLLFCALFMSGMLIYSQNTAGTLNVSLTTKPNGKSYSPKHVMAVWIEDEEGNFVKTLKLNGDNRKEYLYKWNSSTSGNTTDATTGATLGSHITHLLTWDCTNTSGELVPDGLYSVQIEYTSEHAQGPTSSISFNKGTEEISISPADEAYFIDMSLDFTPDLPPRLTYAHEVNNRLGRGVNLGNTFESPRDNSWGMEARPEYLDLIKDWGFSHIRVPIRWSDYAGDFAPYKIEPGFLDTITKVVDYALQDGLHVMINMHHYDEFNDNPGSGHLDRFLAIWKQISEHFVEYPDSLLFEFLNEPHQNMDAAQWNTISKRVLDTVRIDNPTRICVVGPPDWNNVNSVDKLVWPADTNMIMTVHYYNPFQFTHQGASWVGDNADSWLGTTWDSTSAQRQAVINDFAKARAFSETQNVPVHVGEFGAYSMADDVSRAKWTAFCARTFESFGFSWAYWEFGAGFGVYDRDNEIWRNFLLNALTERIDPNSIPPDPWDISNGNFYKGLSAWKLNLNGTASASVEVIDQEARIDVSAVDESGWHVQFFNSPFQLIQGAEYHFGFDAWSNTAGQGMNTYLGRSSEPYQASDYHSYALTTEKTRYEFTFTMEQVSDDKARAVFDLGYSTGLIYIDSVVLDLISMPVMVENISIQPDPAFIDNKGQSVQLSVEVLPANANNKEVSWVLMTGSDIASISSNGLLTANGTADGDVRVRAIAKDGSGEYGELIVAIYNQIQVEQIQLTPTKTSIDTYQGRARIFYEVLPANASNKSLNWTINEGAYIAVISDDGFLDALGVGDGMVTVRASAVDGSNVFEEVSIELVNQVLAESLEILSSSNKIDILQGTLQLSISIFPENTSRKDVSWSITEGNTKASIDATGLVQATGYGNGPVMVKASAIDGSGLSDQIEIMLSNQGNGLEQAYTIGFKAWSSPTHIIFKAEDIQEKSMLKLYSLEGKLLISREINLFQNSGSISMNQFGSGIYILELQGTTFNKTLKIPYIKE